MESDLYFHKILVGLGKNNKQYTSVPSLKDRGLLSTDSELELSILV